MCIELMKFAVKMQEELDENSDKTGWGDMSLTQLLIRLKQEVGELERAIKNRGSAKIITSEAADVANFCMMISDNAITDEECLKEESL